MIPAMLLRPMPRHSLVDLAIHVTTPHRGNARLDLALIATAAADSWCTSESVPRPPAPHDRDVLAACKRVSRAHRITTDDGYVGRWVPAMPAMAGQINARAGPRASVLCAVLLDLLNDRAEPAFAALSRELTRLDRVLPRGEGVEQRASEIAEMIRGEMGR